MNRISFLFVLLSMLYLPVTAQITKQASATATTYTNPSPIKLGDPYVFTKDTY